MKNKYYKIFWISFFMNIVSWVLTACNGMIWNIDILTRIIGIAELVLIPLLIFSGVKIIKNKK